MFSNRRKSTLALVAGAASLALGATSTGAATAAAGTASSSMSAVTVTVTGLDVPSPVTILEAGTLATTDAAHPGNLLGAPWAQAGLAPLVVAGERLGAVEARSDQAGSVTAPATSALGGSALPVDVVASAAEGVARATIGLTSGSIDVVPGLVSVGVESAGIDSIVDGEKASNAQGVEVSGLDVSLGDLVPEDLLAALPIDVLLELLALLPVQAPDLQAVADSATALVADIQSGVNGVVGTAAGVESATAALVAAIQDVADQQAIVDGLDVDLGAAQDAATTAAANATAAAQAAATAAAATLLNVATNAPSCVGALPSVQACIDALKVSTAQASADAQAAAAAATATVDELTADLAEATSLLAGLADVVDQLTDIVDQLVAQLVALLNDLLANLNDLVGALTNLNSSLGDVIDGLLDTTLLGVDGVSIAMHAVSTGDAATSSAGVVCELGNVTVAGIVLGGGACDGSTLTGSLTSALNTVNAVLTSLPLQVVELPQVTVDLLDVASSVTEGEDGYVTSTATVVPLVIDLPSVDVDPGAIVSGLLDQLSGDLLGDLLASVPAASTLDGLGLGAAAAALQSVTDTVAPALAAATTAVGDVVALLPDGSGLVAFTTPGFNLQIDPTSTASFRPGSEAPAPAPAPAPLPATGGGAIVLGALGMAGAAALRRRR